MFTIAETAPLQNKISALLTDDERTDLISYLAEHPNAGVLIQGTGGIRKLRWARQGSGKSGGIRVIYYVHNEMMPVYLLAAFGKNEKGIFRQRKNICCQKWSSNSLNFAEKEMSKAFTEILAGLNDAVAHAKGEASGIVEHRPDTINVKAIREKTGMSQQHFCATFGISLDTLRHWEKGLRSPRGTARVLLKVVEMNPQAAIMAAKGP